MAFEDESVRKWGRTDSRGGWGGSYTHGFQPLHMGRLLKPLGDTVASWKSRILLRKDFHFNQKRKLWQKSWIKWGEWQTDCIYIVFLVFVNHSKLLYTIRHIYLQSTHTSTQHARVSAELMHTHYHTLMNPSGATWHLNCKSKLSDSHTAALPSEPGPGCLFLLEH